MERQLALVSRSIASSESRSCADRGCVLQLTVHSCHSRGQIAAVAATAPLPKRNAMCVTAVSPDRQCDATTITHHHASCYVSLHSAATHCCSMFTITYHVLLLVRWPHLHRGLAGKAVACMNICDSTRPSVESRTDCRWAMPPSGPGIGKTRSGIQPALPNSAPFTISE